MLYVYIMPPEVISVAYIIAPSHEQYSLSKYWCNTLNITRMPELIVMGLGMYIIPPEAISMVYL
jgi:hypothetical protein